MLHNFHNSLNEERAQALRADSFYEQYLKVSNIVRYNSDTKFDMEMQHKDIDVSFEINRTKYLVSEKFRNKDYGDLYIEIFSKYPHTKGWIFNGEANAILYFTPTNVYWITYKSLSKFCTEKLIKSIPTSYYEDIYKSKKTIETKSIMIDNFPVNINLIQSHNMDGTYWETIGVSISFEILRHFGVQFDTIITKK